MLTIRKAEDRGISKLSWLDSRHSFSFGGYRDPKHMGFSDLRVINEDYILPSAGFSTHSHQDMEIVTYVLAGELTHKDSMGTGSVIRPGDVQRMSAGTGVAHSEINHSDANQVHLLQIWILPETKGLAPSYEQKHFEADSRQNRWQLVGSLDGREGSVTIHQDVSLYVATLSAATELTYSLGAGRRAWLQVARGQAMLNGEALSDGDGVAISKLDKFSLTAASDETEVLLFDLAA
jgi:hypothetical protein